MNVFQCTDTEDEAGGVGKVSNGEVKMTSIVEFGLRRLFCGRGIDGLIRSRSEIILALRLYLLACLIRGAEFSERVLIAYCSPIHRTPLNIVSIGIVLMRERQKGLSRSRARAELR